MDVDVDVSLIQSSMLRKWSSIDIRKKNWNRTAFIYFSSK